jgi:hypothetical protein
MVTRKEKRKKKDKKIKINLTVGTTITKYYLNGK